MLEKTEGRSNTRLGERSTGSCGARGSRGRVRGAGGGGVQARDRGEVRNEGVEEPVRVLKYLPPVPVRPQHPAPTAATAPSTMRVSAPSHRSPSLCEPPSNGSLHPAISGVLSTVTRLRPARTHEEDWGWRRSGGGRERARRWWRSRLRWWRRRRGGARTARRRRAGPCRPWRPSCPARSP